MSQAAMDAGTVSMELHGPCVPSTPGLHFWSHCTNIFTVDKRMGWGFAGHLFTGVDLIFKLALGQD